MVEQWRNRFQELGGSASLDNYLCWVNEETRFRQDVGVEVVVSDRRHDGALDSMKYLLQQLEFQVPETHSDHRVIPGEVELQALLEAFETRDGHFKR